MATEGMNEAQKMAQRTKKYLGSEKENIEEAWNYLLGEIREKADGGKYTYSTSLEYYCSGGLKYYTKPMKKAILERLEKEGFKIKTLFWILDGWTISWKHHVHNS